jgi:hypothetical protein
MRQPSFGKGCTLSCCAPEVLLEIEWINKAGCWSLACIFSDRKICHCERDPRSRENVWISTYNLRGTPEQNNWPGARKYPEWKKQTELIGDISEEIKRYIEM